MSKFIVSFIIIFGTLSFPMTDADSLMPAPKRDNKHLGLKWPDLSNVKSSCDAINKRTLTTKNNTAWLKRLNVTYAKYAKTNIYIYIYILLFYGGISQIGGNSLLAKLCISRTCIVTMLLGTSDTTDICWASHLGSRHDVTRICSNRSLDAARARALQQTDRTLLLLSIDGTDGRTPLHRPCS